MGKRTKTLPAKQGGGSALGKRTRSRVTATVAAQNTGVDLTEAQLERLAQNALTSGLTAALAALAESLQFLLGSAGVRPRAARAAVRAAIVPALTEVSLDVSLGPDPATRRGRARRRVQ